MSEKTPAEAIDLLLKMGDLLARMTTFIEENIWAFEFQAQWEEGDALVKESDRLSGTNT